ncbi:MAG: YqhA family protein [Planctomycetota bacterium]
MDLKKLLISSRLLLILPVIGALLLTLGTVVMGLGLIVTRGLDLLGAWDFSPKAAKAFSIVVIEKIDLFLVATVSYITAVGIYKLFVSQKDETILKRIKIEKLVDLENKIIGVLVAALAVAFLGSVAEAESALDVLYAGTGIAAVIGMLGLFVKVSTPAD